MFQWNYLFRLAVGKDGLIDLSGYSGSEVHDDYFSIFEAYRLKMVCQVKVKSLQPEIRRTPECNRLFFTLDFWQGFWVNKSENDYDKNGNDTSYDKNHYYGPQRLNIHYYIKFKIYKIFISHLVRAFRTQFSPTYLRHASWYPSVTL